MKANEVRDLSDNDLRSRVNELKEQNFRLRFKLALGNVDTVKQIRINRRDLARVKTILRERELGTGK